MLEKYYIGRVKGAEAGNDNPRRARVPFKASEKEAQLDPHRRRGERAVKEKCAPSIAHAVGSKEDSIMAVPVASGESSIFSNFEARASLNPGET